MIVPMKKVSLIILGDKKTETLRKLRKLGIMHIEITEGSGGKITQLKEQISLLENALYCIGICLMIFDSLLCGQRFQANSL